MSFAKMLPALAVPVVAVAAAVPANADQYDYVSTLDNNGVYYSSIIDMIDLGKQVCSVGRRAPATGPGMIAPLVSLISRSGYSSSEEAWLILTSAADNMCPDIIPSLRVALSQPVPRTVNSTYE